MFCREIVGDLRAAREADDAFPKVLFFHQGTVEQGDAFFFPRWPEVPAVADPDRAFYDAFGVEHGRWRTVLGARSIVRGVHAALKGNFVGLPVGDVWRMPGAFLIDRGAIVWAHAPSHAGDHPDLTEVALVARRLAPASRVA